MSSDPTDLVARALRGQLDEAEELGLGILLERCPEERLCLRAGRGLQDDAVTQPGDELLILRVAARVSCRTGAAPRTGNAATAAHRSETAALGVGDGTAHRIWVRSVIAATAVLAATSVAAAWIQWSGSGWEMGSGWGRAASTSAPERAAENAAPRPSSVGTHGLPGDDVPTSERVPIPSDHPRRGMSPGSESRHPSTGDVTPDGITSAPPPTVSRRAVPVTEEPPVAAFAPLVDRSESAASSLPPALPLALTAESPAQLFRRANEARQAARWRDATSAYETLIQRFPNSAEAGLALLTLGKLRLASGDAAGAEVALRQHLMRTPGSTRAEALWNLAAVLEQRGRRQEARATLRQLLAEYPNSPYDSAVQARLESD